LKSSQSHAARDAGSRSACLQVGVIDLLLQGFRRDDAGWLVSVARDRDRRRSEFAVVWPVLIHSLSSMALITEVLPFVGAIGLFVLSYIGIAISLYPLIVPRNFTLWEAASSERTQAFLLIGTLVLLPVILMYSGWSYWVFRGKVRADVGYH
jgi:hypothetical protein